MNAADARRDASREACSECWDKWDSIVDSLEAKVERLEEEKEILYKLLKRSRDRVYELEQGPERPSIT